MNILSELKSLLTSDNAVVQTVDAKMEEVAMSALKALEPMILAAIKSELIKLLGGGEVATTIADAVESAV